MLDAGTEGEMETNGKGERRSRLSVRKSRKKPRPAPRSGHLIGSDSPLS